MLTRRKYLAATGGALLAASGLPNHAQDDPDQLAHKPDTLYGHGMVWNRNLPGIAGELKLSFDIRANLEAGTGFGTAHDPVHPEWNIQFSIDSITQEKVGHGETRYSMTGLVIRANNPAHEGLPIRILAETSGDATAIAIRIGDLAFAGAGLVVNAIIAVLIALLLPAVQS